MNTSKIILEHNSYQAIIISKQNSYKATGIFIDISENITYNFNCVIGENGFGKQTEGDKKTPVGIYDLLFGFGWEIPKNKKFPWKTITNYHYWIDEPTSNFYNSLVTTIQPHKISAEKLFIELYKYALVFKYNFERIPYKGSALFIHLWKSPNTLTAGCIAMAEKDLMFIIENLDIYKKPILISGLYNI